MKTVFTLIAGLLFNLVAFCQSGPELVFTNPVLVSGTANQEGALYRFNNVTTGVDAEVKLKNFSRPDIVMSTIDNASTGWNKAFQPEFGLPGLVAPFQNWYIDFEMTFYKAGTNTKQKMDTIDLTTLDVDGDANSITEYVTYDSPNTLSFSPVNLLTSTPIGILGLIYECGEDHLLSILIPCLSCGGDGITNSGPGNNNICQDCDGSGKRHLLCGHAYEGGTGSLVTGPITNFVGIDTMATQVMATYQFFNKDRIKFRYGAKSASSSSNGSGVRLNSTWFREFSLTPFSTLPVKMETFTATLDMHKKANLKWTTSTEINVSHYVVEKSTDGNNFNNAGIVYANGNTNTKTTYSFTDDLNNELAAVVSYRIRSVDVDGKSQYSDIRIIKISKKSENNVTLSAYPNPASGELRITVSASWQNKKVVYELFTANGQTVRRTENVTSNQTETLNVRDLAPGLYILRVSCNGENAQQKIIKQ